MRSRFGIVLAAAIVFVALDATAQLAVPRWVRSVEVVRAGATVRTRPSTEAPRRGTVRPGTRLRLIRRVEGEGCTDGAWIQIGTDAFMCETLVRYSTSPPGGDPVPFVPEGSLTPRAHAFVRTDGTWAYGRAADYFRDQWVESLGQGFGLAIVGRERIGDVELARTLSGLWVPVSELRFANPSDFVGIEIDEAHPLSSIAWVVRDNAPMREHAGGRVVERASRLMPIEVAEAGRGWVRVRDGRFLSSRDVARPTASTTPSEVGENDHWIDVDTRSQTLVAYVGARPVYATLVSTGRAEHPTPRGSFRVWAKLAENDMDDLERADVSSNYAIQAVPWVQYFSQGVALHAAFWHEAFGRAHSHGCVNLAPRDARRIFGFTQPALPLGWDAILPTESDRASIVRVR